MTGLIDAILDFFRNLLGAPDVRRGEEKREAFYGDRYPNWKRQARPAGVPSLEEIPNGYDAPGAAISNEEPSNFRGTVMSGIKRSWTAK